MRKAARKYALCGLLAVDNGLEVDSMEQKEKSGAAAGSVKNTTAEYITSEQVQELKQYTKELACDVPKFLKIFNASDFKFILACDYQQAVNMLKRKKEKMSKDNKAESV